MLQDLKLRKIKKKTILSKKNCMHKKLKVYIKFMETDKPIFV